LLETIRTRRRFLWKSEKVQGKPRGNYLGCPWEARLIYFVRVNISGVNMPEKHIIKNKIDIEVPFELRFGLFWSLLFAIFVFLLAYAILYYIGGWVLLAIGLLPLVLVFTTEAKPGGLLVEKDKQPNSKSNPQKFFVVVCLKLMLRLRTLKTKVPLLQYLL